MREPRTEVEYGCPTDSGATHSSGTGSGVEPVVADDGAALVAAVALPAGVVPVGVDAGVGLVAGVALPAGVVPVRVDGGVELVANGSDGAADDGFGWAVDDGLGFEATSVAAAVGDAMAVVGVKTAVVGMVRAPTAGLVDGDGGVPVDAAFDVVAIPVVPIPVVTTPVDTMLVDAVSVRLKR